jgi:O-antigen/teichoic acid export membrane protein
VYMGSILVHQLLVSIVLALAMVAGAFLGEWRGWLSPGLTGVITITAYVTIFIGLREFARRVSFAELKVGLAFMVDVIACLAQAGGLLLLFHLGALTVSRAYTLFGISSALVAGGWIAFHWSRVRFDARLCARDFKQNWLFSKWVLVSALLWTVATYLYPWLLAAFHGTSVTGLWAACSAIVALGNPVLLGLGNYVGPQIHNVYAASGITAMRRAICRYSLLSAVLVLPIVLVLAGGGGRIVTRVYGGAYAGSSRIVILLALNMLVYSVTYPYSRGLFSLDCAKADMLINAVSITLLFTLGIAAVRFYSALGAAAALLGSTCITAFFRIGALTREVHRRSPEGSSAARVPVSDLATNGICQD